MRNEFEQIAYIMKHRRDGMSDADFKKELETLLEIGYSDGYGNGCKDTYDEI